MITANFPRSLIMGKYGEKFPFPITDKDWLISISDLDAENAKPVETFGRVLFVKFNDIDFSSGLKNETEKSEKALANSGAMSDENADEIVNFINDAMIANASVFVNCHAGICRSGAVVRLLGELGWNIDDRFSPTRRPNLLVYTKLCKRFAQLRQSWD